MKRSWEVRFAPRAVADLERLYDFLLERDLRAAAQARQRILKAIEMLELFPRSCRRAAGIGNADLRELVVPFGASGYVLLFRIRPPATVNVIGIRHQREDDLR